MDLNERADQVRFLIRDRDTKFTAGFDLQRARITRRKILGGLINEYSQVA